VWRLDLVERERRQVDGQPIEPADPLQVALVHLVLAMVGQVLGRPVRVAAGRFLGVGLLLVVVMVVVVRLLLLVHDGWSRTGASGVDEISSPSSA
jgi:hypothetical protein